MISTTTTDSPGGAAASHASAAPMNRDESALSDRDRLLWRFATTHEASHAIAAYHLRFPYELVRVKRPSIEGFQESDFQPDLLAYRIGLRYLDGRKISHRRAVVAVCTVWAIARHMHRDVFGASSAEADAFCTRDVSMATAFLRKQRLTDERRRAIWQEANQEARRIVGLRGFRRALDATAANLRLEGTPSWEVRQAIESAVGEQLQGGWREPTSDEIALAAHFLHESPQGSDQVRNWLVAEQGVRFGVACCEE